ncbi:hypothetical protein Fleli_0189 [Bernardetia litoralis DSM 6794]|uniref:Uncharacterized protein n=1 Tax=Bernardetia litoralis (strain ATCC 23117 / DSM 6794 / NBRC 15988 / NCIMB 1366 / Fx l1 / Sio-4) TaxID=880071 RepID=I4AFF2_BERLS|nr:hypothetical protein [Bernardetia litoralis]AFM02687.1 hypothetical protein Fleli_0189 [Bernardetia litoralis DSM 6794]
MKINLLKISFLLIFISCNTEVSYRESSLYIENYRFDSDTFHINYRTLLETYYYACGCDTTLNNDTLYLDFKKTVFDKEQKCDVKAEYDSESQIYHLKIKANNHIVVLTQSGIAFQR